LRKFISIKILEFFLLLKYRDLINTGYGGQMGLEKWYLVAVVFHYSSKAT
jgi:hypothetical protein